MDTITFEVTTKEAVFNMKEFCRLKDELTYIGEFAQQETSKVIQGTIIKYDGKFYTNELPGVAGICSGPATEEGMVTTILTLFETQEYVPGKCKALSECPIEVHVWDLNIEDAGPIACYAFKREELSVAKKVVQTYEDVDIFIDGIAISKKTFLEK